MKRYPESHCLSWKKPPHFQGTIIKSEVKLVIPSKTLCLTLSRGGNLRKSRRPQDHQGHYYSSYKKLFFFLGKKVRAWMVTGLRGTPPGEEEKVLKELALAKWKNKSPWR
jgi:hypothetical protein